VVYVRATAIGPSIWSLIGVGVVVVGVFWLELEMGRGGESGKHLACACRETKRETNAKEWREE
jgi:hypothetical protein